MSRILTRRIAIVAAAAWFALTPVRAEAQKALVYCPVGIDATGCNAVVAALTSSALFPDGVDAGYDGTSGTADLAGADLSAYALFVVPSLADGPDVQPYSLLRNGTIAARLQAAFIGRAAVWSGTPDVGSTNRAAKDNLIRNLAGWARADVAGTHGPGVVALQDNSDDETARYGWVGGISALSVAGDPTFDVYSNVQALTSTGQAILTSGGVQLGYTNMASFGLLGGTGTSADATGGHSGRVVLVSTAGDPSGAGIATVVTDREDYFPPDTVIVTGAGWAPGETVHLLFQQDVNPNGSVTLTTLADEAGHIFDQQFVIDSAHIGVRFTLTATGQTSGLTAQATFTDATGLNSVTMLGTQTPTPVAPGGTVTYGTLATNSVQVRFNGNGSCTVTMSASGLPVGAVASFAPTTLTGTSTGNMFTLLTVTTNAGTTPTGTTTVTVRATGTGGAGNDCSTSTTQTATATLVVRRPSTTTVTGPASSAFGQLVSFSASVTGAAATPTGTVQFKDGATNLGAVQTLSGGSASVNTSALTVGGHSITAVYSGDANYTASTSAGFTHTVNKADQTITFTTSAPAGAVVGGTTYTVAATATSGLTVAFTSQTPSVCTSTGANGSAINFIAAGTCTVAGDQAGNANFNAAPQVTQTFSVGKGNQTIAFTSTAPGAAAVGGPTYTAAATGGASGNPVTFSSLTPTVCTSSGTNGATISFIAAGSCTVAADQAGNPNYNAATQATQAFTVGKANQTIAFDLSVLPAKTFGDADFSVASFASASSGLPVSLSSGSITRCTVSPVGLVHIITAAGNCMVIASQPGDANYNAAPNVQQTFNVAKAAQTITFTSTAPVGAIVGGPTYTATATATSGLTVTFSSSTTGVCTSSGTNGATITFVGGGTCTVAANQTGNGDYNAAPQVTQSFAVSAQAPQTIAFTSTAPSNAVFGGTYAVSATATSGLTVTFSSLTTGVCTVAGSTVSFVGVGNCTVAADQAGNASFLPAPQVIQTFAVGKADQAITFAALADKTYGATDFGVSATASSLLATTFAASGQCSVTGATVHLTGAGSCTITASQAGNANYNAAPDEPRTFTIHGAPVAPVITVANKDYDGTTAATIVTRNLTGVVSGDDISLTGGTAVFTTKHAGTAKPVTADGFGLAGGDAANYVLSPTSASTTANIARLAITVTAATDSREYDGTNLSAATPTTPAGSIQTGDVAAFTQTFDNKNIGTGKTLTPAGAVNDGNSGLNYLVSFHPVTTGEITAKALTGSITAADKPYDGNTSATITSRTLDGVVGTEDVTYVGGTATFDNRNAGAGKTVNATGLSLSGGDAGNYTVNTTASTTANIDQLPITVTAVADSKTYDGSASSDETPSVSVNAIILPDVANFTQAFNNKNVGTGKTLTPSGAVTDGNGGANYLVSFVPVTTGTIEHRTLTVTASASSRPYNGTRAASVTLSDDRITDDVLTVNYVDALFSDKNVGTGKTVTVSGLSLSGTDGGNYVLAATSVTASADITPVILIGHFTADNKVYNGSTAAVILTQTLTGGIISGDDVSLTGGTATFSDKNVGTPKTVTGVGFSLAGVDGTNYALASTTLTTNANITRRDLTVTATGVNKVYDGNSDATVTLSDDRVAGDVITDSYTSATFANKNVGNGKPISVTGISIGNTDAGNYTLLNTTASASANITVATATGHFTAANKVYDGGTAATIIMRTLTGTFGTDDVSLVGGTATFSDKHAGVGKTVTGNGFSITGGDATNYVLASSTLTTSANIDQRPVTVTADAKSKVFGQADPPLTYFISSGTVVAGDPFSGALTRTPGEAVGSWAILQGTLTLGPNYYLSYIGASLTINPWSLTGFYQPVDMPTGGMVLNSIKGGQTVPLKFEIFAGAVEKTDVSAVQSFVLNEVSCPTTPTIDDIELTSTGGTVLRYDGPAGQFIQNWQTPKTAGKCYKVTMTAADAVSKLIAYFKTK